MKYIIRGEIARDCLIVHEAEEGFETPESAVHAWRNKKVEEWSNAQRTLVDDFANAYSHSASTALREVHDAAQEKLLAIKRPHGPVLIERTFPK